MQKSIAFLLITCLISCHTVKPQISQIDFKAGYCFGTCPVFEMSIRKNGSAFNNAIEYNNFQGKFRTTIKKQQLDSLMSLISEANLLSLQNGYHVSATDHPTYTLRVKQKNGQTKAIRDYGPAGPENLKLVYRYIFSLRESQDWR